MHTLVKDQKIILSPQLIYSIIEKEKTGSAIRIYVVRMNYYTFYSFHYLLFFFASTFFLAPNQESYDEETTQKLMCFVRDVNARIGCRVCICGRCPLGWTFLIDFFLECARRRTRGTSAPVSLSKTGISIASIDEISAVKISEYQNAGYLLLFFWPRLKSVSLFN